MIQDTNVLSNKPTVLKNMCDILGNDCRDLTVDLLSGTIDDTIFMSQLIDRYGQDKVNNAVFASVALGKKPSPSVQNTSLNNGSNSNGNDIPYTNTPEDSEDSEECPVCLSPAIFGMGKTVCQVLSDARRNGKIENNELTCNDIVNDFADGKISNRDMVAMLIEVYGEDEVITALNKVNRVLEDGIIMARERAGGAGSP